MKIVCRFSEFERYDIQSDAQVVRLMATTPRGTYHAEVPADGPASRRDMRAAFKERAVALIVEGAEPCEIDAKEIYGSASRH